MVHFEVVHISQFLFELINEGKIEISSEYAKKITYHDPCYLGRHNGIFDEPRDVLKKVPGLELFEMPDSLMDSLCCGGGGGPDMDGNSQRRTIFRHPVGTGGGRGSRGVGHGLPVLYHQL